MGRKIGILGLATLGLTFALAAQDDTTFVTDTIRSNLAEIRMGELAQQRGSSESVRDFGKMLVTDHSRGLEKSSELAKSLDVTVPTEPTAEATRDHDEMAQLSGKDFDRHFAMGMVVAHAQNIVKYRKQIEDGSNTRIVAFAREGLPTLEKHLQAAREIEQDLGSE